jgi:hypothetical protein
VDSEILADHLHRYCACQFRTSCLFLFHCVVLLSFVT